MFSVACSMILPTSVQYVRTKMGSRINGNRVRKTVTILVANKWEFGKECLLKNGKKIENGNLLLENVNFNTKKS